MTEEVAIGFDLKNRIIEAARDRFLTLGFSKVTMDELVGELGISKKTMYQYFRSKDELLDAAVERQLIQISAMLNTILLSSDHFIDKLYKLYMTLAKMSSKISKRFQSDLRKFRPDLWKHIDEVRRKNVLTEYGNMLDEGVRLGLIRNDVNKEIMLLMYIAAIEGVVNPDIVTQHSFSTEEAYTTILRIFVDGILTDSARTQFHQRMVQ